MNPEEHSETTDYLEQLFAIARHAQKRAITMASKAGESLDDPDVHLAAVDAYIKAFVAGKTAEYARLQTARVIALGLMYGDDYAGFIRATMGLSNDR